jgi:diaminopimelate decarboxylase
MKANSNVAVLRHFANLGAGFDLVSGGELQQVLVAGSDVKRSVFAGVGKTEAEIKLALENEIFSFHVESEPELARHQPRRGQAGREGPHRDPHQSGRRRPHPRQDHDRQERQQIRHPAEVCRGGLRGGLEATRTSR